jgi:uncharacterized membrane protein YfcA
MTTTGRTARLAVIGTLAGLFSGLFGVGGGTVIVPLLILWMAYDEKAATGTSLAAIVLTAAVGVVAQGAYGNVDVGKAAAVGVPALVGVLAGTALQQRLSSRNLTLAFAVLLAGVAIDLIVR